MNTQKISSLKRILGCWVLLLFVALLAGQAIATPEPGEEWVVLPVIVNIVDDSDASALEEAIKKANAIFAQAKIRLVVRKTNQNVHVGDGDGDLTEAEGDQALRDGQQELDGTFQDDDGNWDGTGVKITLADDCWVEQPGTLGWAVHRTPVVVVESSEDANSLGSTIVHELIHTLTVPGHRDEPNDIMYPTDEGGTTIHPDDINEIFPEAKKRGTAFKIPRLPRFPGWRFSPFGIHYSTHIRGAILDPFDDVLIDGEISPDDPGIGYADVRQVTFFAESPFAPSTVARLEIQRAAVMPFHPVDSFFDVFFDTNPHEPGPELLIQAYIHSDGSFEMTAIDLRSGEIHTLPYPVLVHTNEKFDGPEPILYDHTVEMHIPIELLELDIASTQPILCHIVSRNHDYRWGPDSPLFLIDQTEPFTIRLTGCGADPRLEMTDVSDQTDEPAMVLKGCGFVPHDGVQIRINDRPVGTAQTDAQGAFMFSIRPWMPLPDGDDLVVPLEPGTHEVLAISLNDTQPSGAKVAMDYFAYCPQGVPLADLNGDCKVDLQDLALFAADWLVGASDEVGISF